MAGSSSPLRSLHTLHVSSNLSSSMKLKTLIQTCVLSHFCRVARALNNAKSILVRLLKEIETLRYSVLRTNKTKTKNKNYYKLFLGSFRLHYNWCSSSHVMPVPSDGYYDSTWNSIISSADCGAGGDNVGERQLSGYLHWLEEEEKVKEKKMGTTSSEDLETSSNEIDKLADMFIANCHEKFRLEKQESYRRFQEMMARSV